MKEMNVLTPEKENPKRFGCWCGMILLAAILACCQPAGRVQAADTPQSMQQLWGKAAAYRTSYHWVPGCLVQHEQTYDLRGRLEEDRRVVIGYSPGRRNHIRKQLLSAEENGKDISWQLRTTLEDTVTLDGLIGDSPFAPGDGQRVSAHFNGGRRSIEGHLCIGFDFIFITEKATIEGVAWLDRQTGLPTQIHSRIVSVPFMQGRVKVSSYSKSEYFILTDKGDCLLERTQVEMDVAIPKLWFKGTVKSTSVCRDHWKFTLAQQNHMMPRSLRLSASVPMH